MEMVDLSRVIYDGMPKIPILPDVHVRKFLSLEKGPDYNLHPYLSVDAAKWMVKRGIKMFGIDCITVDLPTPLRPKGFDFPVHRTLLGNEVLIAENVTNLGSIVGKRTRILAFPLRVKGSDAGHARIVAEVLH